MSLFDRILRKSSDLAATDVYGVFADALRRMQGTRSGVAVTREKALRQAVVLACLRVLSEGVAQVPWKLMQKLPPSSGSRHSRRREAIEHPLYDVIHRRPNPFQTSYEFRETMMLHAVLCGRATAFKARTTVGARTYTELILLDPGRVTAKQRADWSIVYEVRGLDGTSRVIEARDIWRVNGPSWDGVDGLDMLSYAREAIGLSIAAEESHSSLHANSVQPSGIYSVEGTLKEEQYKALRNWLLEQHAGPANAGKAIVLDRNAKFNSMAMKGVDAQHMETRRHQVEEVCRFFRVLPIMVGYSDKTATFASAEQMFLAHVVHTLMPWYERIQQSADVNLLTPDERAQGYYTKLSEAGLLRGAMKDTAEYLARLSLAGIMERNEARGKLDLDPLDGLDAPLTPVNMTTDPSGAPPVSDSNSPTGGNQDADD